MFASCSWCTCLLYLLVIVEIDVVGFLFLVWLRLLTVNELKGLRIACVVLFLIGLMVLVTSGVFLVFVALCMRLSL